MNTIKDLAINWWDTKVTKNAKCELTRKYYPRLEKDYGFNKCYLNLRSGYLEDIFYQEVIIKWYVSKYGKVEFDYNEKEIRNIYLKEHTKEQPQSVDNTIDVEEKKVFNDFEEWIVVRFAETGFKGFNFDEIKEIVDKAKESREKRKAIEDNVWDEAFKRFHKNDIPDFVKWELKENYSLIKL